VSAQAGALGHPRLHLRATDSTNDRARALARSGAVHGTLVTATEQHAGRGRQGRTWSGPAGGALLCSLVLRDPPRLLPLAAAVAVASVAGEQATIKWPNDVLLDGRKLAGILVEGRPQEGWAVLGIGVNVAIAPDDFPPELRDRATSLAGAKAEQVEPTLAQLLAALERWLPAATTDLLDAYRARDALRGREISWTGGSGRAAGIDGEGRLVVAMDDGGQTALDAGEVHLGLDAGGTT
jgi:BirA family biotin operon repressor/biotin-[acetyl-CoA-carboxylase] ligase